MTLANLVRVIFFIVCFCANYKCFTALTLYIQM